MHTYGILVDLVHLVEVCRQFGLSLGKMRRNRWAVSSTVVIPARSEGWGRSVSTATRLSQPVAAAPFLQEEEPLARHARHITTTARREHRWDKFMMKSPGITGFPT